MSDEAADAAAERRLDEAVAAYEEAREAGSPLGRDELVARYPDIAPALDEWFSNHNFAAGMGASLRMAFGTLPAQLGRYHLEGVLGRGGMGVVFRARDTTLKRTVALKTLDRLLATALDLARFRSEAETAASLAHPNIVPVLDVGVHEGQPYYTMALVEGSNLQEAAAAGAFTRDPRGAARLLATAAEAVDEAHRAGVIHRDLKPANILLDRAGRPLITDFGLAKQVDAGDGLTGEGDVFGTAEFMAPEQAAGTPGKVGVPADVYSLGAILYLLLTGKPPLTGASRAETLRLVQTAEVPFPCHPGGARVDGELAAICLKALSKEARARYAGAGALAADLRRWLAGEPVAARRASAARRGWRVVRRHPSHAVIAALLAGLAVAAVSVAAARAGRRREILDSNLYTARQVGREFLERMQHWGGSVARAARDPRLVALLEAWERARATRTPPPRGFVEVAAFAEQRGLQAHCERLHDPGDPSFENWNVLDAEGTMLARTPRHPIVGTSFRGRDYFRGTLAHTRAQGLAAVHVSRVYRSQADGFYKFDVSVPVVSGGGDGRLLGVLAVSVTTGPNMGLPHLHDERRKAVLLAPSEAADGRHVVLMHPAYAPREQAIELDRAVIPLAVGRSCEGELSAASLDRAVARRLDYGAGPAFTGAWLAGLAPVGNTGFVVVIQRPQD